MGMVGNAHARMLWGARFPVVGNSSQMSSGIGRTNSVYRTSYHLRMTYVTVVLCMTYSTRLRFELSSLDLSCLQSSRARQQREICLCFGCVLRL